MTIQKSVCVFCGSKTGNNPVYAAIADQLGRAFAAAGIRLIFGGGEIGLMGVIADAVLATGGTVTGVIPESLQLRELAHRRVEDMRIVPSMHIRKALMAELATAFVALPGGLGTFEELCEVMTWAQLDFHQKPIILLNVNNYYAALLKLIDHGIEEGFMQPKHRKLFHVVEDVGALMTILDQISSESPYQDSLWKQT